jgi:hypothetical protein
MHCAHFLRHNIYPASAAGASALLRQSGTLFINTCRNAV